MNGQCSCGYRPGRISSIDCRCVTHRELNERLRKIDPNEGYYQKEIDELKANKQDKLIAGQNITIEGSLISADLDSTNFYNKTETDELLAEKQGTLTAGENIAISEDNVISADTHMLVTLTPTGAPIGGVTDYTWTSEHTYAELVADLDKVAFKTNESGSEDVITPTKVYEALESGQDVIFGMIPSNDPSVPKITNVELIVRPDGTAKATETTALITNTTYTAGDNIAISPTNEISAIIPNVYGFDTVADMKTSTELKVGDYAITAGFHAKDDGGAATYQITDTGTANEQDVIAVGNLYANLVVPDNLTPQMFGAYGDGVHNDTDVIQDCIDYVSGKPIKLFLDRKYLITPGTTLSSGRKICLKLKSNIIIEGNGFESGLIVDDTNDNIYWAVIYADTESGLLENISLENFKIYQNDNNLADIEVTNNNPRYIFYTSYGITNYTLNHILLDHVYSRDVIMMPSGETSSNVRVTNCIINYFNVLDRVNCSDCTAIFLNCKNYTCSDNILYGANFTCKGGIEIHGHDGTANNNKIIGFTDCMHVQPSGTGSANFIVSNNYMYGHDGINLWDNSATSPSTVGLKNVIINNNFILVSAEGADDNQYNGIRLSSQTFTHPISGLIIKNNTIDFTDSDASTTISAPFCGGITLNNSSANINDTFIENNIITNSVSSGIFIGTTSGTATTTHENIIIRGNIIKDNSKLVATNPIHNSSIAFYNKYLKSIVVEDNMLINNIVGGGPTYAFFAAGTSVADYPCYFIDNIIKSVNSGDMTVGGISTWIYENDKQIPIFSPNGTKYYIKVANDGTLSAS